MAEIKKHINEHITMHWMVLILRELAEEGKITYTELISAGTDLINKQWKGGYYDRDNNL